MHQKSKFISVQLLIKNQNHCIFRSDIELAQSPAYSSTLVQQDQSVTSATATPMKDQHIYDYVQKPLPNVNCSSEYEIVEIEDK